MAPNSFGPRPSRFEMEHRCQVRSHLPAQITLGICAESKDPIDFDLINHDLFTGGSLPGELFAFEFWDDLKLLMKPDG